MYFLPVFSHVMFVTCFLRFTVCLLYVFNAVMLGPSRKRDDTSQGVNPNKEI